jgi:hypothetical protein
MNEYEYESVRDWKESHTLDFSMGQPYYFQLGLVAKGRQPGTS